MSGKDALRARAEITIASTALAQDGFLCGINLSYAKKYTRDGDQRIVKESFTFPASMSDMEIYHQVASHCRS